jgi:hypothetical protein
MDWVSVALEEYRTLRQESLSAIEQMQRTLQIGLVSIGVLTGFAVNAAGSGPAVQMAIACAGPTLAGLVVLVWLEELKRTVNAGAHIALIERQIADRFDPEPPPLVWERQIQEAYGSRRTAPRYVRHWPTTAALFAATLPVLVLGLVRLIDGNEWVLFAVSCAIVIATAAGAASYQQRVQDALTQVRRETSDAVGALSQPAAQ